MHPIKVLFIHHSTGGNLIKEGNVRKLLVSLSPQIDFYDHGYNLYHFPFTKLLGAITFHTGLSDKNGVITGEDYNIVLSNNSPKEYAEIFSRDKEDKTLKAILSYDIIAFKNCYPTTRITSDEQLQKDQSYYESIRDSLAKYPEKKFILFTPPPLRKELTNKENAQRAKQLALFLTSSHFLANAKNISVFDFFQYLADTNGYLKKEYTRLIPWDSHPNKKANKTIAPLFAEHIFTVAAK